jgi:colanic acid biosynthesis glycosyl transferase WcaI
MAAWLAAQEHEVRVVTAPPYYPAWKVGSGFKNWWQTAAMDCHGAKAPRNDGSLVDCHGAKAPRNDGSLVDCHGAKAPRNDGDLVSSLRAKRGNPGSLLLYRCPLWVPAAPGGTKRLLHLASFALSSLPVMLRQVLWRADVVWVVARLVLCANRLGGGPPGGQQGLAARARL